MHSTVHETNWTWNAMKYRGKGILSRHDSSFDDKSRRFSRKISSVTTSIQRCRKFLWNSAKKEREKRISWKTKLHLIQNARSSKNDELAATNSQLAWIFNKRSSRWKPQTNLQQRNPAESGRHASATISFFFRFERDKKEETINLQPCLLLDRENFSPFFETENIPNAIFDRDLYEQKTILGGGKFSQQMRESTFQKSVRGVTESGWWPWAKSSRPELTNFD